MTRIKDILLALRNPHGWAGAALLTVLALFSVPVADFYLKVDADLRSVAVDMERAKAARAAKLAAVTHCFAVAGESIPVLNGEGKVLRCDPRRRS